MVRLPEPGSGRAWTAVERDGRRVAAIIHDAELDTGPELVNAAAAGAALAIDNERLKADLRARVEELRLSRVRIVEATDHARRRIERDLHDGAQQQLVSLSLDLRLLKAKLNGNEAAAATGRRAVGEARDRARRAARARARHPPGDPHRARARAGRRRARPARSGAGRGRHLDPRAAHAGDRGRRLLRRRGGADERRQVRAGRERARRPAPRRRERRRRGRGRRRRRRRPRERHRPARAGRPPVRARRDARGRDARRAAARACAR